MSELFSPVLSSCTPKFWKERERGSGRFPRAWSGRRTGMQGWVCPGRGRGQQVSAGSTEPAHTGASSAGVLFMRRDSEKSRETRSIPFAAHRCSTAQPLPLNRAQQQEERERTWQQPGLSVSSSKLSDVFPRLTSPPPQHCNFTGKGIPAISCPPIPAPLFPSPHFSV